MPVSDDELESLLAKVMHLLKWDTESELLSVATNLHYDWSYKRLKRLSPQSLEALMLLAPPIRLRILEAPLINLMLRRSAFDAEDLRSLQSLIALEDASLLIEEGAWSALGDLQVQSNGQYHRMGAEINGVILDTLSPRRILGIRLTLEEFCSLEEEAFHALQTSLHRCINHLQRVNTAALCVLKRCVKVIATGIVPGEEGNCFSGSVRHAVGLVTITNGQNPYWTEERLSEALIHESIHNLLFRLEHKYDLYLRHDGNSALQIRSPWSKRNLEVYAFVHACFVWFGLWHHWNRTEQTSFTTSQMAHIVEGFLKFDLAGSEVAHALSILRPPLRYTLDTLFIQMRSAA